MGCGKYAREIKLKQAKTSYAWFSTCGKCDILVSDRNTEDIGTWRSHWSYIDLKVPDRMKHDDNEHDLNRKIVSKTLYETSPDDRYDRYDRCKSHVKSDPKSGATGATGATGARSLYKSDSIAWGSTNRNIMTAMTAIYIHLLLIDAYRRYICNLKDKMML